jgi:hypothetical protein
MTETQRLLADVMERYGENWSIGHSEGPLPGRRYAGLSRAPCTSW